MLAQFVHPIHYLLAVVTHAPTIMPLWRQERPTYRFSFLFFYAFFFALIGFSMAQEVGTGYAFSIVLMVFMYGVMLAMMSVPQMIFDVREGHWIDRFSDTYLDSSLAFHGYSIWAFLFFSAYLPVATAIGTDPMQVVRCIFAMSASLFAMYAMQMAHSRFDHVRLYMVVLAFVGVFAMIYVGSGITMEQSRQMLINAAAAG